MPLPAAKKMSVCPFTSPSEGDRKSTRLNSSHSQISYAVFFFRKKTRLNSSHSQISYAVFCLKKKTLRPPRAPGRGRRESHALPRPALRRRVGRPQTSLHTPPP